MGIDCRLLGEAFGTKKSWFFARLLRVFECVREVANFEQWSEMKAATNARKIRGIKGKIRK